MATVQPFSVLRTEISGIPIRELVQQFGTPAYVYDAATIVQRIEELRDFDVIRYAQKANSNLAILDLVRRSGAAVDTVSANEIRRALLAGFRPDTDPPQLVYTADIFDEEVLELVLKHGIHCNLGSPDMIDQLGQQSPGANVTLRINPGFGHGHSQKTNTGGQQSKHGIWHEQLADCLQRAKSYGMSITGIHMHIGSGTDLEHLSRVCQALHTAAVQAGKSVTAISAGGGLPIAYRDDESTIDLDRYYQLWDDTRKRLGDELGHAIRLEIEPGRYVVAQSGYLIAEIRAIKQMGENLFYLVDAGFNNLARPILYGAYHPMSISPQDPAALADRTDPPLQPVVVGGPLCESGDIFTQKDGGFVEHRELPQAVVGDWLVIECAGAYGSVMASNYNSKPLAAEVLVEDGSARLVRSRQTFEDLIRSEILDAAEL